MAVLSMARKGDWLRPPGPVEPRHARVAAVTAVPAFSHGRNVRVCARASLRGPIVRSRSPGVRTITCYGGSSTHSGSSHSWSVGRDDGKSKPASQNAAW